MAEGFWFWVGKELAEVAIFVAVLAGLGIIGGVVGLFLGGDDDAE